MTAAAKTETKNAPNPTPAIELDTSADYELVARGMKAEAEDLKKLAEKNQDAGYPTLARRIRQDADQISTRIVPRFERQTTMEFTPEGLSTAERIERLLLDDIRRAMQQCHANAKSQAKAALKGEIKENEFDLEAHVTRLAKKLGLRIADFGHECAERGVNAGLSVREVEEGDVVDRALEKLAAPQDG